MGEFVTRRSELLVGQGTLAEIARLIAPGDAGLRRQLDEADRLALQAYVTLAVVGAEGAGKSSLVDAIVDDDIVPREAQMPGTVAPVEVYWSPEKTPSYTVKFAGREEPTACADAEEFRRFLLQRYNPHNREGVEYGTVAYNHPVLQHGLVFVDMPGLEGASDAIRQQAEAALARVDRALLVVRDRQYGTATRLLKEQGSKLDVEGVVSNWSADGWSGTVAEQKEFVASQKRIITEELGWDVDLDAQRVFVLHVPSVDDCQLRPDALVASSVHKSEVARFRKWVTGYMGKEAATRLLEDWQKALRPPARRLAGELTRHVEKLGQLAAGSETVRNQALSGLEKLERSWLANWAIRSQDDDVTASVEQHWAQLSPAIAAVRHAFLAAANAGASASPPMGSWTVEQTQSLAADLRKWVEPARQQLEDEHEEAVLGVVTVLREKANRIVADLPKVALLTVGPLPPITIEGHYLLDFQPPDGSHQGFFERFSNQSVIDRMVRQYREAAASLDTSLAGALGRRFQADVDSARQAFASAIRGRIAAARSAAIHPGSKDFRELRTFVTLQCEQTKKILESLQ